MTHDPTFARPARELGTPIIGGPIPNTARATGGKGLTLDARGRIPSPQLALTRFVNTTAVNTPENTSENDLQTITLDGGLLKIGDVIHIMAAGTSTGPNTGIATIRLKFGGAALISQATGTGEFLGNWMCDALVVVTGASAQKASANIGFDDLSYKSDYSSPAVAIANAITVKTVGQTDATADEITSELLMVEIAPASVV